MYNSPAPAIEGRMLCASVLAYSVPDTGTINPPNNNIQQTVPYFNGAGYSAAPTMIASDYDISNAACTVGITQDGIVLAFRGTVYNSITDWINDLLLEPVTVNGVPGKVHDGFNKAVNVIFAPILQMIKKLKQAYPAANFYITGHSKGAGMAPIAAYYLYKNGIKAQKLYLYAPPLPGTKGFASAFNSLFPATFLYENYLDIVPLLAPSPTTAGGLDYYFIENGSEEALAAAVLITGLAAFDYSSVGSTANTFYIPQPVNGKYSIITLNNEVYLQQLKAIGLALMADDIKQIA
ncbi:MAG TPA: lipase family protein, partial [Chitinophagaceae bacterium]|nr:lipase family protein [Chitinophagaceae bacterium]